MTLKNPISGEIEQRGTAGEQRQKFYEIRVKARCFTAILSAYKKRKFQFFRTFFLEKLFTLAARSDRNEAENEDAAAQFSRSSELDLK